jgi:hypothetical protein
MPKRTGLAILTAVTLLAPTRAAAATPTPTAYAQRVTAICAGALLFEGSHQLGTRAGAIAVSNDIRATGLRRLRRVAGIPRPAVISRVAVRWLTLERRLVKTYAAAYLGIWNAIEQARTTRQKQALPALVTALIHAPDQLRGRAGRLELELHVPDCTGGGNSQSSDPNITAHP